MTKNWISVYPAGSELKTPERKELYKLVLNDVRHTFGDGPGFVQALKILFFEGKIETYSPTIPDESELSGKRRNRLGTTPFAFVCLGSPVISLDFYREVLSHYSDEWLVAGVLRIMSQRVAYSNWPDELICRIGTLLLALDKALGAEECGAGGGIKAKELAIFLKYVLNFLWHMGKSSPALGRSVVGRFHRVFADFQLDPDSARLHEEISGYLRKLLGGEAKQSSAYTDEWFVEFVRLYHARELDAAFLEFIDVIYEEIPQQQRIGWDGEQITNYPVLAE